MNSSIDGPIDQQGLLVCDGTVESWLIERHLSLGNDRGNSVMPCGAASHSQHWHGLDSISDCGAPTCTRTVP